ncbi:hypothetical protein OC25_25350 [Pedobacter kyungheensis]|uniref:YD repeat-containing protein n=1 Tax=Pedobacter kyungheensis TaxID=1069985 RepID=A0A0C1FNM2_9SPHI|nr:hypothetical protein [Pedobacter kyungheensis]KIA89494.1 hypothetical protein OC25_25350 [Pedobacter kyungheensis]
MIRKTILKIIMICSALQVMGQSSQNINMPDLEVKPTSPNAASLGRYGEIPVGLFTGVPEINIPLYSIKLKSLTIPLAVSYHAAGNKVNDIASNVGLGWSLAAGGAITCSVNGLPDIQEGGWLQTASQSEGYSNTTADFGNEVINTYVNYPEFILLNSSVNLRTVDTQPDMFFLSLPGKSIKFFFDRSAKIVTVPYDPIKIEFLGSTLGFKVTDENDNVYEFKTLDVSNTNNQTNTSFLLSKIISVNNEQVDFNYNTTSVTTFWNQPSETRYFTTQGFCSKQDVVSQSYTYAHDSRLTSISCSNGETVNFEYNFDRLDLQGAKALTNIKVLDASSTTPLVSYLFSYTHTTADGAVQPQDNFRLRLLSIQEEGKPAYQFSYDIQSLPNRLSKNQDHWGYYNAASNTTLLPADAFNNFPVGANREPVEFATQAGILKKIIYPTGGSTVFNYEGNRAVKSGIENKIAYVTALSQDNTVITRPFTVVDGSTAFKAYFKLTSGQQTDPETGLAINCRARILDGQGNVVTYFAGTSNFDGDPYTTLQPGQYSLEVETTGSYPGNFKLEWSYQEYESNEVLAGGLRIASILDFTGNELGLANTRRFEYKKKSGESSGVNKFEIYYSYDISNRIQVTGNYPECHFKAQSSSVPLVSIKGSPVYYTDVIEYNETKSAKGYTLHRFSESTSNSSKANFPFAPLYAHDWIAGLPIETIDYKFSIQSNNYFPVKKVTNDYNTVLGHDNPALNERYVVGFNSIQSQQPVGFVAPVFKSEFFSMVSSWPFLKRSVETVYNPADTTKYATVENKYFYDNPNHGKLTRQEISTSKGEKYSILFRYPKDYDQNYGYVSSPVVEKRVMLNNGSTDRLVDAEITAYKAGGGMFPSAYYNLKNNIALAPSSVPMYSGTAIDLTKYEKRADFSYDGNNNLIKLTKEEQINTSYIYSYYGRFVIAKIQNAEYSSIEALLGGTNNINTFRNSNPSATEVANFLASLRSGLPNAQITSYTYSPLVGMTSSTDAKGMTTYYEYDAFQRLKAVKDQNGNILKQTDYHYKN